MDAMDQPVQLPYAFQFPAYDRKMYFIHIPGSGWRLAAELEPEAAVVGLDQLTPPMRNDYFTFHRMVQYKRTPVKTVKEQIIQIRDEHVRSIEAIRNDSWLPRHRRGKVPRLDELDGAKINVTKYLHWTPMQIHGYRRLCRLEYLAVQGVAHKARVGIEERERYMKALAAVFPEEWGRQKDHGTTDKKCKDETDDEQRRKEHGFDLKEVFEDSDKYFFPGPTSAKPLTTTPETAENRDDRFERLSQHDHKPTAMKEIEQNTLSVSQSSRTKHSIEMPERNRTTLQIRSPRTLTPSHE